MSWKLRGRSVDAAERIRRRQEEATRWLVILQAKETTPQRVLRSWQKWEAVPANRVAFDSVVRVWQLAEALPRSSKRIANHQAADRYVGSTTIAEWLAKKGRLRSRRRRGGILAVGLAAGVMSMLFGWNWIASETGPRQNRAETGVAEQLALVLDDGTRVYLGSKSLVTANIGPDYRDVVLHQGEALFEVAKDPKRPFRVDAGAGLVTAVGTAFVVRRRADDQLIVTVNEGVVEVARKPTVSEMARSWSTSPMTVQRLQHGQEMSMDARGRVSPIRTVDTRGTRMLRDGRLTYRGESLRVVIEDVNRYSRHQIRISDAAAGDLLYSGTVFERDVSDWIEGIGKVYPELEVVRSDTEIVIRMRSAAMPKD